MGRMTAEPRWLEDTDDFKGAFKSAVQKQRRWEPLQPGDIVDIVAPASASSAKALRDGARQLKAWGFRPRIPKRLLNPPSPILANTDAKRFEYLKKALFANDSKLIWCLRGGYGAIRLLPELEKLKKPKVQKYLIGYSDITTLHSFLQNKWGWPTLHGPLVERIGSGRHPRKDMDRLLRVITGEQDVVGFSKLEPVNTLAKKTKAVSGPITGGNLCVLTSSLGSPWQYSAKDKILFLEEIGEKPHRFDRFLVQLEQSGYLKGCKAIVFGNILTEESAQERLIWKRIIHDFAATSRIPVYKGLPVGHGKKQRELPFGTMAKISKNGRSYSLIVSTGVKI